MPESTDPTGADPVLDNWALTRLTRYLWVKPGYLWGAELEAVLGSDLDAEADQKYGPGKWRRGRVSTEWLRHTPEDAPAPPTTVRADLCLGWAYYQEVTPWWEKGRTA